MSKAQTPPHEVSTLAEYMYALVFDPRSGKGVTKEETEAAIRAGHVRFMGRPLKVVGTTASPPWKLKA